MSKNRFISFILFAGLLFSALSCAPREGIHTLHLLTTNDVHGRWFDSTYVGNGTRQSLMAVNYYVDSIRNAVGEDNVILIDAGDCLQGDNASYYYNYVDTLGEHLFTRLVSYMKYDAVTVGNHDVETGHRVYDRVARELKKHGIPFMGGNAVRNDNGKPYFCKYKLFRRAGLRVLVLGYTNANNPAWMDESLWEGMHFESLIPLVQKDVDLYTRRFKPQVVIVSVHSATGEGDGRILEAQGKDLYNTLSGVDFVVCSHDHRETVVCDGLMALLNTGNRAKFLGHGELSVNIKSGKPERKEVGCSLIPVDKTKADPGMREVFRPDFEKVRQFSREEIGMLAVDLRTRDAYSGMCDYVNLLHTVCLRGSDATISFAAPLTYNGVIPSGVLIYNDLFTIYPYENHLYTMSLTGREIKDYLEYSYSKWLAEPGSGHALGIAEKNDPRNNQKGWSFMARPYNFDSAAGIDYTVDVSRPAGERVKVSCMADGSPFYADSTYTVAMTSYRASGAGGLLTGGAGIAEEELEKRIVRRYPEIRELIYAFVKEYGLIDSGTVYSRELNGRWEFIPVEKAGKGIAEDLALMF